MHQLLVVDVAHGPTARGKAAIFSQGDHAFGFIPQGLGASFGCGNATLPDQLGSEAPKEGFALVGGASQPGDATLVAPGERNLWVVLGRGAALGEGDANALQGFNNFVCRFGAEVFDL